MTGRRRNKRWNAAGPRYHEDAYLTEERTIIDITITSLSNRNYFYIYTEYLGKRQIDRLARYLPLADDAIHLFSNCQVLPSIVIYVHVLIASAHFDILSISSASCTFNKCSYTAAIATAIVRHGFSKYSPLNVFRM